MKRILTIAILLSYSIASFGVSLNYFYCCGQLKSVSFIARADGKNCTTKTKKGCCDNRTVSFQLKADQKNSAQAGFHFDAPLPPFILYTNNFKNGDIASSGTAKLFYKRPPPDVFPSRRILFCLFRI